jgi:hypothetical protein
MALPDDHRAAVVAAWELSIALADRQPPHGIARLVLEIAALLDPNGIPSDVFATTSVTAYCAERLGREVDGEDTHDALRALHRLNLVTTDARTVRMHALVQRVVWEATEPDREQTLALTAANALLEAWPDVERDTTYAQLLRANTFTLHSKARRHLLTQPGGVPSVLMRVGESLGESGQVAAAASFFQELSVASESEIGAGHPSVLIARGNLASWRGRAGDPAGAISAYEQLLADTLRVLGPDHPNTLLTRRNLASWCGEAGDPAGAVSAYEELLTDTLRVVGPDHPDALATRHNLASWRGEAGDPAGAVSAYEELLTDTLRVLGPDHADTLTSRANLARWRGEAGDAAGAVSAYEELLTDMVRVLGPDHADTLTSRANLARWREYLERSSSRTSGRYHIDVRGSQGVQVGDGNIQHNTFGTGRRNE